MDSRLLEFFSYSTQVKQDWSLLVQEQPCRYLNRKCVKVRKSAPQIAIGSCTVKHGAKEQAVVICPHRMLQGRKIFIDCIHLLSLHEPGNELHVVSEIPIPGGSVDYFVVSVKKGKVKDFVGVEVQTMDTTGTIWGERQAFLASRGVLNFDATIKRKNFGINWKMTAKTALMQLHHKIDTFEHLGKHLVLVVQDCLLDYMKMAFSFDKVESAKIGHSMHFHVYALERGEDQSFYIDLKERMSTDRTGLAYCLGLQGNAQMAFHEIVEKMEAKLSDSTLLKF
ncbi:MAG TPA: hypothetical protein ENJ88_08970 [Phaeodactylibacter sp.]|nr:hypothetical protein [Phaeodactylibacter sp.]